MSKIILPTAELFFGLQTYDPLLCFYSEGDALRGLIRDAILLQPDPLQEGGLLELVLSEYERSVEMRMLENMFSRQHYAASMVEMIVEEVELQVREMMQQLFRYRSYQLCKKRYRWLGADFVVTLETLP